jgi:hypothetical protein
VIPVTVAQQFVSQAEAAHAHNLLAENDITYTLEGFKLGPLLTTEKCGFPVVLQPQLLLRHPNNNELYVVPLYEASAWGIHNSAMAALWVDPLPPLFCQAEKNCNGVIRCLCACGRTVCQPHAIMGEYGNSSIVKCDTTMVDVQLPLLRCPGCVGGSPLFRVHPTDWCVAFSLNALDLPKGESKSFSLFFDLPDLLSFFLSFATEHTYTMSTDKLAKIVVDVYRSRARNSDPGPKVCERDSAGSPQRVFQTSNRSHLCKVD